MEAVDPRGALARLVAAQGESYARLSTLIGRNPAYLQQFVTRGSPRRLAERDRQVLAAYLGVGEAELGGPPAPPESARGVAVPRLDVAASAGPGAIVDGEPGAGAAMIDPALVRALGLRADTLSVIRARGDSMEPRIADGDTILVDRSDTRVGRRGAVYVLRHDGVVMVKRLVRSQGGIAIVSDNPAYPPLDADATSEVIGRVVWLGRVVR